MTDKELAKPIQLTVYDPVFGQEVVVFCNQKFEAYTKWQKKLGVSNVDEDLNPNFSAFSTHVSGEDMPNKYIIWVNHFAWTLEDQSSLIHEIIHTVFRIWSANNISFCSETQEFLASSVDKLYSSIAQKIMLREKRSKK
jgi:hypothetical protein